MDETGSAPSAQGDTLLAHRPNRHRGRVGRLLAWQLVALAGQALAVCIARADIGLRGWTEVISYLSIAVAFGSALWVLTVFNLTRAARNAAVVCLGITPTLMWRATNPLLFTGYDEQLHMRTLGDILSSHRLLEPNPLLAVSSRYPGLEAVTTFIHQFGIPTMASAYIVILVSRLVLVTVLCDAVEQLTGSARAGGIAVAIYGLSSQFIFFNSQYSYQTMAIPLALAAISMIIRARRAEHHLPLLAGASVCLFALAVTHHVTSFITAAFLVLWTLVEKRPARIWVAYGACAAIASTLVWAIVQRQLLSDYLGPIIDDVGAQFRGGARRQLFKDDAGTTSQPIDKYLLIYYAAALCLLVGTVLLIAIRWWRRGEHPAAASSRRISWNPHLMMLIMAGCIPVFLAARVVPKGGELFDRSNSFLFFAVSYLVAGYAVRLWWRDDHPHFGTAEHRRIETLRVVTIILGAAAFVGGYVLGSGPTWARLPGPFMAAADTRAMDAELQAAADWMRAELPLGSRITADRVSAVVLAAQAGVWPVMKVGDVDAPALYVAPQWGLNETGIATAMQVRFMYVDTRLADQKPPFGSYFFQGETGGSKQFTVRQLTKFDRVPGISLVYRHGPVSVYDLSGLGIPEVRSGWLGPTPQVRVTTQIAVGLAIGLLLAFVMRSRLGVRIRATWTNARLDWGPALTGATLLGAVCLTSVLFLLMGVWLTPLTLLCAASVVVLTNHRAVVTSLRQGLSRIPRSAVKMAVLSAVPLSAVVAATVYSAATQDIIRVREILDDPNAVHVSLNGAARQQGGPP